MTRWYLEGFCPTCEADGDPMGCGLWGHRDPDGVLITYPTREAAEAAIPSLRLDSCWDYEAKEIEP